MTYKKGTATASSRGTARVVPFVLMALIISILIVSGGVLAANTILLQDDFNDNALDPAKWTLDTNIPAGSASVVEQNGRMELTNRGMLITAQQFDPAALCGITITGEWTTAGAGDDLFQIATRSDGIPDVNFFGGVQHGVEFVALTSVVLGNPNRMAILGRGSAIGTVTETGSTGSLIITPGETFIFELVDDGFNLSFTLRNKANPTQTRTVTATSTFDPATNFVSFYNRELCCNGTHVVHLDNIAIENGQCPFNFGGFLPPVNNPPMLNKVKAGQAIPVKFSLNGDQGLNIFAAGFPASQQITCDSSAPIGEIEETVTAGHSSLSYNPGSDQYSYIWKTDDAWAGTCRQLIIKLTDGSTHVVKFTFK